MRFIDLFKLSTRMFKARTSRTLLTILGISVGISAIIFLVSLGYGLQETLLKKITTADSLLTLDVSEGGRENVYLDNKTTEDIKKIGGVSEVSTKFQIKGQGSSENFSSDLNVAGVSPSFMKLSGIKVKKGEMLNDENPNGIVVSENVARALNKDPEDILEKEITFIFYLNGEESSEKNLQKKSKNIKSDTAYKVIGIIDEDESIVYINSLTLQVLNVERFSEFKVKCNSAEEMSAVRNAIEEYGLSVSSLSDTIDQAKKVFGVVQIALMLFGIIALIVSAIGMFNTMTIALLERTEEIGIMKSIGASNRGIAGIFLMESTIMGFLGGLGGVILGIVGGKFLNFIVNIIAKRFGGEAVTLFSTPLWFILLIIGFSAFVGFSTGVIPARRASQVDPLEALRYK